MVIQQANEPVEVVLQVDIPLVGVSVALTLATTSKVTGLDEITDAISNLAASFRENLGDLVEVRCAGERDIKAVRRRANEVLDGWHKRLQEAQEMKLKGEKSVKTLETMRTDYYKQIDNYREQLGKKTGGHVVSCFDEVKYIQDENFAKLELANEKLEKAEKMVSTLSLEKKELMEKMKSVKMVNSRQDKLVKDLVHKKIEEEARYVDVKVQTMPGPECVATEMQTDEMEEPEKPEPAPTLCSACTTPLNGDCSGLFSRRSSLGDARSSRRSSMDESYLASSSELLSNELVENALLEHSSGTPKSKWGRAQLMRTMVRLGAGSSITNCSEDFAEDSADDIDEMPVMGRRHSERPQQTKNTVSAPVVNPKMVNAEKEEEEEDLPPMTRARTINPRLTTAPASKPKQAVTRFKAGSMPSSRRTSLKDQPIDEVADTTDGPVSGSEKNGSEKKPTVNAGTNTEPREPMKTSGTQAAVASRAIETQTDLRGAHIEEALDAMQLGDSPAWCCQSSPEEAEAPEAFVHYLSVGSDDSQEHNLAVAHVTSKRDRFKSDTDIERRRRRPLSLDLDVCDHTTRRSGTAMAMLCSSPKEDEDEEYVDRRRRSANDAMRGTLSNRRQWNAYANTDDVAGPVMRIVSSGGVAAFDGKQTAATPRAPVVSETPVAIRSPRMAPAPSDGMSHLSRAARQARRRITAASNNGEGFTSVTEDNDLAVMPTLSVSNKPSEAAKRTAELRLDALEKGGSKDFSQVGPSMSSRQEYVRSPIMSPTNSLKPMGPTMSNTNGLKPMGPTMSHTNSLRPQIGSADSEPKAQQPHKPQTQQGQVVKGRPSGHLSSYLQRLTLGQK